METATLYERLGGEEGIITIVDDVVEAHMNNPNVSARFLPYKERPEHLAQVKKHTVNFFCAGSGGPQQYGGRDMTTTHRGMNINEQEYIAVIEDIMAALEKNGVGMREQQEVLMIGYSLRGEILRV